MTDPVILLGTQSNGETLPVQVDDFGRLVAEGLQGSEGPPGPEGPQGPQGPAGGINLPPDPYEGALLGWLNNELAWIGSPPVPIPPGVFGPITGWNAQDGLLTVEGEMPAAVGSGVYVWQCNQDGTYFTEGWNTSQVWSDNTSGGFNQNPAYIFDGSTATETWTNGNQGIINFTGLTINSSLRVYFNRGASYPPNPYEVVVGGATIDISALHPLSNANAWVDVTPSLTVPANLYQLKLSASGQGAIAAIEVDGKILVNTDLSLNLRVNQVLGQSLLGIPNVTTDFSIGKYLKVPEQRVAPWVLYGNDPTSLIDHLRSS